MASSSAAPAGPAAKAKVLIVDDQEGMRQLLRALLESHYHISEADSGAALHKAMELEQPDLVLLDMRLPDANGLDLVEEIKKRRPGLRVVIVTGYASVDTAVEAIKRGANDYMPKPFTPDELSSMASKVLGRAA